MASDGEDKKLLSREKKGRVLQAEAAAVPRAGCTVVSGRATGRPALLGHRMAGHLEEDRAADEYLGV